MNVQLKCVTRFMRLPCVLKRIFNMRLKHACFMHVAHFPAYRCRASILNLYISLMTRHVSCYKTCYLVTFTSTWGLYFKNCNKRHGISAIRNIPFRFYIVFSFDKNFEILHKCFNLEAIIVYLPCIQICTCSSSFEAVFTIELPDCVKQVSWCCKEGLMPHYI